MAAWLFLCLGLFYTFFGGLVESLAAVGDGRMWLLPAVVLLRPEALVLFLQHFEVSTFYDSTYAIFIPLGTLFHLVITLTERKKSVLTSSRDVVRTQIERPSCQPHHGSSLLSFLTTSFVYTVMTVHYFVILHRTYVSSPPGLFKSSSALFSS